MPGKAKGSHMMVTVFNNDRNQIQQSMNNVGAHRAKV